MGPSELSFDKIPAINQQTITEWQNVFLSKGLVTPTCMQVPAQFEPLNRNEDFTFKPYLELFIMIIQLKGTVNPQKSQKVEVTCK